MNAMIQVVRAEISDGFMAVVMVIFVVGMIVLAILKIMARGHLKKAEQALTLRDYADASRRFRVVAGMEFQSGGKKGNSRMFEHAIDGLRRTYAAAGRELDLSRYLELRADLRALQADKKYHSVLTGSAGDNLTKDGLKIRDRIVEEARKILNGLDALDSRG
jgi:hypothetical protein